MNKTLVQEQFGKTAASYLTSTPRSRRPYRKGLIHLHPQFPNTVLLDAARV
jgi:hypothetical protein